MKILQTIILFFAVIAIPFSTLAETYREKHEWRIITDAWNEFQAGRRESAHDKLSEFSSYCKYSRCSPESIKSSIELKNLLGPSNTEKLIEESRKVRAKVGLGIFVVDVELALISGLLDDARTFDEARTIVRKFNGECIQETCSQYAISVSKDLSILVDLIERGELEIFIDECARRICSSESLRVAKSVKRISDNLN